MYTREYVPNNIFLHTRVLNVLVRGNIVVFDFLDNRVVLRGGMVSLNCEFAGDHFKGAKKHGTNDRDEDEDTEPDWAEVDDGTVLIRGHIWNKKPP